MAEYSVLIIDDDIWMQRILSKTLSSYGFKTNYLASNGIDGIAKAVEHTPNLIVLDILMPELSGHLTLKILKTINMTKNIPVIMVSALSDVENLGKAVKSGTAGFISKPFTRTTVYEKLLDLYGKEKLDMIIKGEAIREDNLGYLDEDTFKPIDPFSSGGSDSFSSSDSYSDSDDWGSSSSFDDEDDFDDNKSKSVNKDKLSQHYNEDDKKSIDSIKALLLKNKR